MKKLGFLKAITMGIQAVPVTIVGLVNFPVFVENTGTALAASGAFIGIFLALIFRDNFKEFFKTPTTFKISLVIFLLSLVAVNIGEQFLLLSGTVVASSLASTPTKIMYENTKNGTVEKKLLEELKGLVK